MSKAKRRSPLHKRDRQSSSARSLLDSFHWDWDQRILLELVSQGVFTVEEIREMRWNQLRLGFQTVMLKEKELSLSEEVTQKIIGCLEEGLDFQGNPRQTPEDKLFTHKTGKEIHREILSWKD